MKHSETVYHDKLNFGVSSILEYTHMNIFLYYKEHVKIVQWHQQKLGTRNCAMVPAETRNKTATA
jgi:hypothetical protein